MFSDAFSSRRMLAAHQAFWMPKLNVTCCSWYPLRAFLRLKNLGERMGRVLISDAVRILRSPTVLMFFARMSCHKPLALKEEEWFILLEFAFFPPGKERGAEEIPRDGQSTRTGVKENPCQDHHILEQKTGVCRFRGGWVPSKRHRQKR